MRTQTPLAGSITGAWIVKTEVSLASYVGGSCFHTAIKVYVGQYDVAYWGRYGDHVAVGAKRAGGAC